MRDISRKTLEKKLREMGWKPVEFDLLGGDYWHRPPHGLRIPLVNHERNRDKLAYAEREAAKQDREGKD